MQETIEWIDVKERPHPDHSENVLVKSERGTVMRAGWSFDANDWVMEDLRFLGEWNEAKHFKPGPILFWAEMPKGPAPADHNENKE